MIRNRITRLFAVVFLVLMPWQVSAAETAAGSPPIDVRLVVDISGSMKETDPDNLRRPAVRLLAGLLPDGAGAGVWTFGQYVNMLVPHDSVDQAWRGTAVERSKQINSVALHTNLGLAIEKASNDWLSGGTLEHTHLILLSDGKVDIPNGEAASRVEEKRILQSMLPELKAKGLTVHTVGLSEFADVSFLRTLADETGGTFRLARSAEALNLAFADALNAAAPQSQLPIEGNQFSVDEGVEEFTALIFTGGPSSEQSQLRLAQPGGELFTVSEAPDSVRWLAEPGYDLITVTDPQAGNWEIDGDLGQGSRVTVVSNLRMVVSPIPSQFSTDEPLEIEVAFYEDNEPLKDPGFLDVMEVTLSLSSGSERKGSKVLSDGAPPEDGVYRESLKQLSKSGVYRVEVVADGGTFARKFSAETSFVVPGEEPPVAVVSEPLVPDLSQPLEPLALNGEQMADATIPDNDAAPEPEPELTTESEPAAEPAVQNEAVVVSEPLPEPVEPKTPVAEGQPIHEPGKGTLWGIPVWVLGAIAALIVIIVGFVIFAVRRKQEKDEPEETLPVLEETVPEPEPEEVPELVPEAEIEAEEQIPEVTETIDPEPKLYKDELEEFGLEDFDLSEFDDLPEDKTKKD
ncbi:VWA domain-containing protein [Marinobacter sp. AL4B]|uniref:VWA domain-containing protein n=1 Tax=Marinobacter sp. AL4B TaxID=2871173 RepID=UPI002934C085|nr:VWA domain-containing protein [Marinobacter sp. AL4B]